MRITKNLFLAAAAILVSGAWVQSASAGTVISDNFDLDTAQTNWSGDSVFLSIPQPGNVQNLPSVDLVGPGYFDNLAYSTGNSVDLDGSTGTGNVPAGELKSVTSLATGNYTVSFLLSGNMRGFPDQTVRVAIGSSFFDITPTSDIYTLYTLTFLGASGNVTFTDLGPSNQQGDLLDEIVVATTPLPATWSMLLAGFMGLGFIAFRGARNRSASVSAV